MIQLVECLQWALCWTAGKLRCESFITMAESVYISRDHFATRSIVALGWTENPKDNNKQTDNE